jgi:hypothetical protein
VAQNEQVYEQDLQKAVEAVVDKFPTASGKVAVAH